MTQQKPSVILVDDEMHLRKLIKSVVEKAGFHVVAEAANGVEAINLYKEHSPDLMLLDINMPFKSGDDVLQELSGTIDKTCVIMLTSITDLESIQNCIDLGASSYIRKDTPIAQMQTIITDTWKNFSSGD